MPSNPNNMANTDNTGASAQAPPPKFTVALAERLVQEAQLTVSVIPIPTPEFPGAIQVTEWYSTEPKILNIWNRTKLLGKGGTGTVFLEHGISGVRTGEIRAVKVLTYDHPGITAQQLAALRHKELLVSIFLSQPWCERHFVKTHSWFTIDDAPNLGMQHLQGDFGAVQLIPRGPIAPDHARVVMKQLLQALEFLHSQQLVHRDLKPQNIMVHSMPPFQESWIIKLGDFGSMEYYLDVSDRSQIRACGTPGFIPPDVLGYCPNDEMNTFLQACKADMFAAGAVLFIMLTRLSPFGKKAMHLDRYAHGEMPIGFPFTYLDSSMCGPDCKALVQLLLAVRPAGRPMASSMLMTSKWLQGA